MSDGEESLDLLIVGSTPFAAVLAGYLAQHGNMRVGWHGHFPHRLRPQRGFDLDMDMFTRPESWQMLGQSRPRALELLHKIGSGLFERTEAAVMARTRYGAEGLAHMRNVAPHYGAQIERMVKSDTYEAGYVFRNVARVFRRPLIESLPKWLDDCGVVRLSKYHSRLRVAKNGTATIWWGDRRIDAHRSILADDEAIWTQASHMFEAHSLRAFHRSSLLLETRKRQSTPVSFSIENRQIVYQRPDGVLDCVFDGAELPQPGPDFPMTSEQNGLRLAGRAVYTAISTRDGGLLVGDPGRTEPFIIVNAGISGLFFVPALGDYVLNPDAMEHNYFRDRSVARSKMRDAIAEFAPLEEVGSVH